MSRYLYWKWLLQDTWWMFLVATLNSNAQTKTKPFQTARAELPSLPARFCKIWNANFLKIFTFSQEFLLSWDKDLDFFQPPSEARWFSFWSSVRRAQMGHTSSRVFPRKVALFFGVLGWNLQGVDFGHIRRVRVRFFGNWPPGGRAIKHERWKNGRFGRF